MEKEQLLKFIEMNLSFAEIGKRLNLHRTTISKYCKKFNINTKHTINCYCVVCGKEITNNEFNRRKCPTCITRIRRYRLKKRAVEYKGGKCVRCGFDNNIEALVFHHKNPNDKEFGISEFSYVEWKLLVEELDKCDLLCANCHSVEHSKYNDENFLFHANNYKFSNNNINKKGEYLQNKSN